MFREPSPLVFAPGLPIDIQACIGLRYAAVFSILFRSS
jgi:hypothetical protein